VTNYSNLKVEEVLQGIAATRAALKRGEELIEKVAMLGAQTPRALAELAGSTAKLHDHLEQDLRDLEAALKKALDR
jgi:hypothetical protein